MNPYIFRNALRRPAKLSQKEFRIITEFSDPKQSCGCQFCSQIKAMRSPPQPWNIKYMPLSFLINILLWTHLFSEDALRRPAKLPQKDKRPWVSEQTHCKTLLRKLANALKIPEQLPNQSCGCQVWAQDNACRMPVKHLHPENAENW